MKCWVSAFNARGCSRGIIVVLQVGAVKIYVAAVKALRKEEGKPGWNSVYHQNWCFSQFQHFLEHIFYDINRHFMTWCSDDDHKLVTRSDQNMCVCFLSSWMCHPRENLTLKHYEKPNIHWKVNQIGRFWHFGVFNVMEWSQPSLLIMPLCLGALFARLTLRGSLHTLPNIKPRLMGQAMHLNSFFFFFF